MSWEGGREGERKKEGDKGSKAQREAKFKDGAAEFVPCSN